MLLVAIAAIFTGFCVLASVRRLVFAVRPTTLDARALAEAIDANTPRDVVARAIARAPDAIWENDLMRALGNTTEINEQLLELDFRASRWARVPRVCASIATSAGFLLASLALREGLLGPSPEKIDELIFRSVNVLAVGIAGATFCAAVHFHARKAQKMRLSEVDALVEKLEALK